MPDPIAPLNDTISQVCFVTDDLDALIARMRALFGRDPVFVGGSPKGGTSAAVLEGRNVATSYRQCLFRFANIDIEFIEPGPEPSTWRETLDRTGPGFHHIAIGTRAIGRDLETLGAHGMPVIQTGDYESRDGRYAYVDGIEALGGILELLESDKDRER